MKTIKKGLIVLLVALVLIQFYRPEKNNAELRDVAAFEMETKPNTEVAKILKAQCYDCHSNKTTYPWYTEVAPVSFWIGHHIEEGNEHFNVSKWDTYNDKKKDHKLEELVEEVEEGEMPLSSYTWMHGSITQEEKEALIAWAKKARENYK
ncbi:heme-binding domain-containing protein [Flavivirga sp. 57AJ16]|uniref:heme-binding domain-containing protein n=1 Tax=Flavivirga sp. 57AJ16 TaxID=3025307 RepID=UPI00236678ED|nr:heme-binding domain-containing protein [Flavivirga sp. 57AJ16]MDD7887051.1 heme-binding domain-containing protein [Flavivirga sp. 57AJ16]